MSIIDELLSTFKPISLEKMDGVKLLNRMDAKFVFRAGQLPGILAQLASSYYILEIGQVRLQHYETLYFDTPGHTLYLNHHNKRMNRLKVRCRKYVDSGSCFFEIKFKNNRQRTSKERNRQKGPMEVITGKQEQLLTTHTRLTPAMLLPSMWVNFSRITLVSHSMLERVTIDTGLTFQQGPAGCTYPGIVIAEIKQDRSGASVLAHIMRREKITENKISKYCLGIISLNEHIRQNNFKQKLRIIKKLNHAIC